MHARPSDPREACEYALKRFKLRALRLVPFYGTLAMHAPITYSHDIPIAATDGRAIILNPHRMSELDDGTFAFIIVHELMHLALQHIPRRKHRDAYLWNVVTDAIINHTISNNHYNHARRDALELTAPHGIITIERLQEALTNPPDDLHTRSAEDLYALLHQHTATQAPPDTTRNGSNGSNGSSGDNSDSSGSGDSGDSNDNSDSSGSSDNDDAGLENPSNPYSTSAWNDLHNNPNLTPDEQQRANAEWRRITANAAVTQTQHERNHPGSTPAHLKRLLGTLNDSHIDWRAMLWRHLTTYPHDFTSHDRRFIQYGQYLDTLDGQHLTLDVCIDTSGSIDTDTLTTFASELNAILNTYPSVTARVYYCDTELDGPHPIEHIDDLPPPTGGGGTDFTPFFEHLNHTNNLHTPTLAVYLTDGYGHFPNPAPTNLNTLWVVTPGGLHTDDFPFGDVIHIDPHA